MSAKPEVDAYAELQRWISFVSGMREELEKRWNARGEELPDKHWLGLLKETCRNLPLMSKEARQFEIERREGAKKLSKDEKLAMIPAWFRTLAEDEKRKLIEQLTQAYNQTAQGDRRGASKMG